MKEIYKRQPVERSLPSGYQNLDAINYSNLSNFKGLQAYDNPLIAEKNSTHSCKNVYVDEHGNLTVRPALTPVVEEPSIVWKHVFSDGKVLTAARPTDFGFALQTWSSTKEIIDLSINAFEANDKKYVFLQALDLGHLALYDITDGNFTVVEGVTLLDDPVETDISHYNILNSNVIYEYSTRLPPKRTADYYTVIAEEKIETNGYTIYPVNTSNVLAISKNNVKWYRRAYSIWMLTEIALPFPDGSLPDSYFVNDSDQSTAFDASSMESQINKISRFIQMFDDGSIYVTEVSPVQTEEGNLDPFTRKHNVYWRQYVLKPDSTDISPQYGVREYTALTAITAASDGYFVALRDEYSAVDVLHYVISSREDITVEANFAFQHWGDGPPFYYIACTTKKIFVVKIHRRNLTDHNSSVHRMKCEISGESLEYSIDGNNVLYVSVVSAPDAAAIVADIYQDNTSKWHEICTGYTLDNTGTHYVPSLYAAQNSVSIRSGTHGYEILDGKLLEYTGWGSTFVLFDGELYLNVDTLVYQQKELLSQMITRPQGVIPVISDINERVITSFFLDNCWWFITEHCIFGTGVDGNGLSTPERFDPLKYFKISECITGAIRISDTSFWVFHNDGAYLIYKTQLTLTDGTEYRWLYTATAKSKGCDFDNALHTLPISNNVVTVTALDICNVVMRENVQSDERILVPMTTQFTALMRELLATTKSVQIFNHKYLTIFCLNRNVGVSAVVYDNVTTSWWYWELPVEQIFSIRETEECAILYCKVNDKYVALRLTDDEYYYQLGNLQYEIYADRLDPNSQEPTQIEWHWQSAVQIFDTIERRKQLLFTTFVFDDYALDEYSEQEIEIGYHFDVYSREYLTSNPDATTVPVYRVSNRACRTTIGSFNYLQLNVYNEKFEPINEDWNFTTLTKPKICCISMKYRVLRGEL
jgi:hypothetical protein